jgi:2-oxoglutarate ferredoxin oxidoreductase subunit alpha
MKPIEAINDFVIKFANVNGSGSASANELFAKAILRMGVPVSPRNIFPSNIQGLPTWYEARVCEQGYQGRRGGVDMMVAMNPQTWDADLAEIEPGGYLFYDSTRPIPASRFRADVQVIGVPLTDISNAAYTDPRQRQLFKNIIYVGALSVLLDVEAAVFEKLFAEQYRGKELLLDSNVRALHLGRDYVTQHLQAPLGIRVRRADRVGDQIFTDGNSAAALGCVYGAPRWPLGTPSRRRPRCQRLFKSTATSSGWTLPPARTALPSFRPRTNWPLLVWWSAPAGTAPAPLPPHRAPACR